MSVPLQTSLYVTEERSETESLNKHFFCYLFYGTANFSVKLRFEQYKRTGMWTRASAPPNLLPRMLSNKHRKSLLESNRGCDALFKAHWVDHYSKLHAPTESTTNPIKHSVLVTQAGNLWPTTGEGANLDGQNGQGRPMFIFASACSDASVPPLKEQRIDGDEEEKKKKRQHMRENGQLISCRRIRISPAQTQARFLRQVIGIHRFIYDECVDMQNNGELNGTGYMEKKWVRLLLTRKLGENIPNMLKNVAPFLPKQQSVEDFFQAKKAALL